MEGIVLLLHLLQRYSKGLFLLVLPIGMALLTYTVLTIIRVKPPNLYYIALGAFAVGLLIALVIVLFKWIQKRRKGGQLEDALGQGAAGSIAQQGEIEALRKAWKESVKTLKTTGAGKGGITSLPWFVIIGEPASGKSTLLRQSGIDFPVGDAAVRGLQGTRNCDWWFSNIGVFLDTAGRYVSDESANEWASFLDLVRRHRTDAPVNGVIVAIPASDLTTKDTDALDWEAKRIRARLDELIDHLGVNFPVWITVTKVDLVGGFVEFFGQADAQTRRQMMGWTLDQAHGMNFSRDLFNRHYAATVHRLREIRPVLVAKAKLRDRPMAYAFPDEMAELGDKLGNMMQRMFEPNIYQDTPFLRGVYITSATQQGTPLQRAAAHIREMLGASPAAADPHQAIIKHAYFVKDLMGERVVADREMTWTTQREVDRGKTKRLGQNLLGSSFGVLFTLTVLAFGLKASDELDVVATEIPKVAKSGAVERTNGYWRAMAHASDDNYKNLGLSQQGTLKESLRQFQWDTYTGDVLPPMMKTYEDELERISVQEGLGELIVGWEAFRQARSALTRVKAPYTPPPPPEEDENGEKEDEGDEKKEPVPVDYAGIDADEDTVFEAAPEGVFLPEEAEAFTLRGEVFEKAKIIGKAEPEDYPQNLMLAIWRNGTETVETDLGRIKGAYHGKLLDYLDWVAAGVGRIDLWQGAFEEACRESLRTMRTTRVEQAGLRASLDLMARRAGAPPAAEEETDPAAPGASADDLQKALSTLGRDLKTLEDKELIVRARLMELERFASLEPWLRDTTQDGATGRPEEHLIALANALQELQAELEAPNGLVPRPWGERGGTVAEAVESIDAEVDRNASDWRQKVLPHLQALAGAETPAAYNADDERYGLAVEAIEPGMRRNALLRSFLELPDRSAYPALASRVLEEVKEQAIANPSNPTLYNSSVMSDALGRLAALTRHTTQPDLFPRVAASVNDRAAEELNKSFKQLVAQAQGHWDEKCRSLPTYKGDPPGYLDEWIDGEGKVKVLGSNLRNIYQQDWPVPSGLQKDDAARRAWNATIPLRTRYSFFWSGYGKLQDELESKLKNREPTLIAGQAIPVLKRLDKILPGRPGGPEVWSVGRLLRGDENNIIGEPLRNSLDDAVNALDFSVLQEIARYYNDTWAGLKADADAALRSGIGSDRSAVERKIGEFRKELEVLFDKPLVLNRGPGLTVLQAARDSMGNLGDASARIARYERGTRMKFTCTLVPTGFVKEGFPYIRIQYLTNTRQTFESRPWAPNQRVEWNELLWKHGEPDVFTLYMVGEDGKNGPQYRSWSGPDCIRQAIADGGGGPKVVWKGEGKYKDERAEFDVAAFDGAIYQWLMGGGGGGSGAGMPNTCVQLSRGR